MPGTAGIRQGAGTRETPHGLGRVTDEVVVFCPQCKTFETLWFSGDVLVQTRKFIQDDQGVYHDCGSEQPCRLLPRFLRER